jgi:hypothetical protein
LYRLVVFDAVHNSPFLHVSLTWLLSRPRVSPILYLLFVDRVIANTNQDFSPRSMELA